MIPIIIKVSFIVLSKNRFLYDHINSHGKHKPPKSLFEFLAVDIVIHPNTDKNSRNRKRCKQKQEIRFDRTADLYIAL